jgi:hypothetical protein
MVDPSNIIITSTDASSFNIAIDPTPFAVGASTIGILLTNSGLGLSNTEVISFTVTQVRAEKAHSWNTGIQYIFYVANSIPVFLTS